MECEWLVSRAGQSPAGRGLPLQLALLPGRSTRSGSQPAAWSVQAYRTNARPAGIRKNRAYRPTNSEAVLESSGGQAECFDFANGDFSFGGNLTPDPAAQPGGPGRVRSGQLLRAARSRELHVGQLHRERVDTARGRRTSPVWHTSTQLRGPIALRRATRPTARRLPAAQAMPHRANLTFLVAVLVASAATATFPACGGQTIGTVGSGGSASTTTSGANPFACTGSQPELVLGQPSGYEQCANGMVHRPSVVTCPSGLPRTTTCSQARATSVARTATAPAVPTTSAGGCSCRRSPTTAGALTAA